MVAVVNYIAIFLVPIAILIGLFLVNLYAFQGVRVLTDSFRYSKYIRWAYWILIILAYVVVFVGVDTHAKTDRGENSVSHIVISTIFIGFFLVKYTLALTMLVEDLCRFVIVGIRYLKNRKPYFIRRRLWFSIAGLCAGAIMFGAVIYGVRFGKYDYKVRREIVYFKDLPEAFDGFTILQLSDIHAGSFTSERQVQKGIDMAKAQNADLFVFTGDIVNGVAEELVPWISYFGQIKTPYGQFSVLGNHDYGDYMRWDKPEDKKANLDSLKSYQAQMGYKLLLDENVKIEKDGKHITLMGVQNWGPNFLDIGDLDKAIRGVDTSDFKILLSHDPSHWKRVVKDYPEKVQLTLSGHTHGFQYGIETRWFKWSPIQRVYENWAGLYEYDGRYLYVNRGFGFVGFSGRIGIWPEITVIELRKE